MARAEAHDDRHRASAALAIRLHENASQTVFARYLNVAPCTLSQWERDGKRPSSASLEPLAPIDEKGLRSIA